MLGAAVVKTAAKLWLKDNAIAADAAAGVVEIIQAQVSEAREQRRARRLFEDLEERVADSVLGNPEFGRLPGNERDAAVLAVADTFDKAKLTNQDLFASDLDPSRLYRVVKPLGAPFASSLSAPELYDRILRNCCAYVVEVANALPGFKTGVFGELLSRQTEIIRRVDQRFDRLPMQLGGTGAETFEPTYLRLVAKQLDKVELFGVTLSDEIRHYPLSVAYVSLSICSSVPDHPELFDRSGFVQKQKAKPRRKVTSTEEALGTTRRAFIRGEAGSGKTTLLQWLAVRCGRRDFDGLMRGWNGSVPLFIRLRRYSGAELPSPQEFLNDIGRNIAHTMPVNWVHDLLRTGRAAVLVDGVDELPESQRARAREWLRLLLLSYPAARYVVTSRPTAAAETWLKGETFDVLEIQPMATPDVNAFVSHWHTALAVGVTDTAETGRIEQSRQSLVERMRTHRHLRMLAVSPLMTALVCALHLDRRMQLPHDRMELYAIALEMLLERRDTEREIRLSDVTISRADKAIILEDLAYWLVRNGWSNASRARVLAHLTDKLVNMHRVQTQPDDVLKHLLDRSGLLRMPGEGQIDFVHKTFQEFLAARAAVAADDVGVLVNNAHDDQWREVVLMAVAHARPQQTTQLLSDILDRANAERSRQYVLQTLAVACVQHAPELPLELHGRLQKVAAELLPPKKMNQAEAMAGAGDLVLELLSNRTRYSTAEAAATIRMATAIGGDHALAIIANCAKTFGGIVSSEVERAWSKFDPEEFAVTVLANSPEMPTVRVTDPTFLSGIRNLPIQELICRFSRGHGDIDYISDLPNLRVFDLSDPKLRSLAATAGHPSLDTLRLVYGTGPVDLTPLGRCESLHDLSVHWSVVKDPSQLSTIRNISSLGLVDCLEPEDVLPHLAQSLRLKRFGFLGTSGAADLGQLVTAPQLTGLCSLVMDSTRLRSVAGIDRWAETLTSLTLKAPRLVDVERISDLRLLEFVDLRRVWVRSLDFLQSNVRLTQLQISTASGSAPDLTPLCALPSLRKLVIWGEGVVDVSGLAEACDLEVEIDVRNSRVVRGQENLPSSVVVRRAGSSP
jgi:hypothetical protein